MLHDGKNKKLKTLTSWATKLCRRLEKENFSLATIPFI